MGAYEQKLEAETLKKSEIFLAFDFEFFSSLVTPTANKKEKKNSCCGIFIRKQSGIFASDTSLERLQEMREEKKPKKIASYIFFSRLKQILPLFPVAAYLIWSMLNLYRNHFFGCRHFSSREAPFTESQA